MPSSSSVSEGKLGAATARGARVRGMLLTRSYHDGPGGLVLEYWLASSDGPVLVRVTGQSAVCFVERGAELPRGVSGERRALQLRSLGGAPVDGLYFARQDQLSAYMRRVPQAERTLLEADVNPGARYLMERFLCHGIELEGVAERRAGYIQFDNPRLRPAAYEAQPSLLALDIETEGLTGALLSVAIITLRGAWVLVLRHADLAEDRCPSELAAAADRPAAQIEYFTGEKQLLQALSERILTCDPDCLVGWNVVDFDLSYLETAYRRHGLIFDWGRGRTRARILPARPPRAPKRARVPGRVVLDGIACLRSATYEFDDFRLESVATALLGRGKAIEPGLDPVAEILRMHREDPAALAHYNLLDCQLVLDIFSAARLIDYLCQRQRLTGLALDRLGGSVAAFDYLYLPRLHRAGYVAPSVGGGARGGAAAPGGYVMESEPGLFRNIIVLDFKSLYPSIIRSFCIDPLGLAQPGTNFVEAEGGARFAREGHLLPSLIAELWLARDAAKRDGHRAMSQAIKIIMNSFYGVLGTSGCRFFDTRLVSSITLWGHRILRDTRRQIEAGGLRVIYGDTDSVFVALDEGASPASCMSIGANLAEELNLYWRAVIADDYGLESQLELEFETLFTHFFMPTMRGSERGSKKRYAGWVVEPEGRENLVVKGLEAVRSDWTALARRFQRELFRRCFVGEDVAGYVRSIVRGLLRGAHDEELVYRKTLRRPLTSYQSAAPPQVRAARALEESGRPVPRRVAYVITAHGPQPWPPLNGPLRPDYQHYLDKQLAPAADGILRCMATSFEEIAGPQLALF